MHPSIRPFFASGVALVGASVIAVTPLQAAPADVRIAEPVVQLSAVPSPLELYPQVIERTFENAGILAERYFADPFPIISATVEVQLAALADAGAALADGDSDAAVTAIWDAATQPVKSLATAIEWYTLPELWAFVLYDAVTDRPEQNAVYATLAALADVVEAALALDLIGTFNAVINIPARIIDAVFNGEFDSTPGGTPGLLSDRGLINIVTGINQQIGKDIRDSAPPAAEEPVNDEATGDDNDSVNDQITDATDPPVNDQVTDATDPPVNDQVTDATDTTVNPQIVDPIVSPQINEATDAPVNRQITDAVDVSGELDEDAVIEDDAHDPVGHRSADATEVPEKPEELDELAESTVNEEPGSSAEIASNENAVDNLAQGPAPGSAAEPVAADDADAAE